MTGEALTRRGLLVGAAAAAAALAGALPGAASPRQGDAPATALRLSQFPVGSRWRSGRSTLVVTAHKSITGPDGRTVLGEHAFKVVFLRVHGPAFTDGLVRLSGNHAVVSAHVTHISGTHHELLVNSRGRGHRR